ncbi:hypothetical protein NDU88_003392 [Pleurodeles waltl]|uniref:Uncharacterized protein n=1 Tax=Pleurodeles waltl TaxID=8319 RepID=A0AAV7UE55_PLEWA|nr:hypothetical protein NDU88_003392 [Pleurodeles waltl]
MQRVLSPPPAEPSDGDIGPKQCRRRDPSELPEAMSITGRQRRNRHSKARKVGSPSHIDAEGTAKSNGSGCFFERLRPRILCTDTGRTETVRFRAGIGSITHIRQDRPRSDTGTSDCIIGLTTGLTQEKMDRTWKAIMIGTAAADIMETLAGSVEESCISQKTGSTNP